MSQNILPWHGTYQNNASKIFVLHKKAICANCNISFIYQRIGYFKCNKIRKLSDQYRLQVSNYVFQLLHPNIDEEIESSLLINIKFIAVIHGPTSFLFGIHLPGTEFRYWTVLLGRNLALDQAYSRGCSSSCLWSFIVAAQTNKCDFTARPKAYCSLQQS